MKLSSKKVVCMALIAMICFSSIQSSFTEMSIRKQAFKSKRLKTSTKIDPILTGVSVAMFATKGIFDYLSKSKYETAISILKELKEINSKTETDIKIMELKTCANMKIMLKTAEYMNFVFQYHKIISSTSKKLVCKTQKFKRYKLLL